MRGVRRCIGPVMRAVAGSQGLYAIHTCGWQRCYARLPGPAEVALNGRPALHDAVRPRQRARTLMLWRAGSDLRKRRVHDSCAILMWRCRESAGPSAHAGQLRLEARHLGGEVRHDRTLRRGKGCWRCFRCVTVRAGAPQARDDPTIGDEGSAEGLLESRVARGADRRKVASWMVQYGRDLWLSLESIPRLRRW